MSCLHEDISLPTLDSARTVPLDACPTQKCLTIYVSPRCPYCRAATGQIKDLRDYLVVRQVATRVVVGHDKFAALQEYAAEFGQNTLLDSASRVKIRGVPYFFVSKSVVSAK